MFSSLLLLPAPKQFSQKHWYLQCFEKTKRKTTRCFETISYIFSAPAPQVKKQLFLAPFLPPLIRSQVPQIQKWTFCLSQSVPQSSISKNWGRLSVPKNAVNSSVLWTYHAFYLLQKSPPPPVASASRKTRRLHLPVQADFAIIHSLNFQ